MIGQTNVLKFGMISKQTAKKNGLRSVKQPMMPGMARNSTGRHLTLQLLPVSRILPTGLMNARQNSKKSKPSALAKVKFLTSGLMCVTGLGTSTGSGTGKLADGKMRLSLSPPSQAKSPSWARFRVRNQLNQEPLLVPPMPSLELHAS